MACMINPLAVAVTTTRLIRLKFRDSFCVARRYNVSRKIVCLRQNHERTPMDDKTIGSTIRAIRERAGLTVTATAARATLTKSTLSKIEKGQVSPPISTLVRVATALGVELASFFTQPETRPRVVYTKNNQGQIITRDGSRFGYAYQALALNMPGKRAEPFVLTIEPGDPQGNFQHQGQEFVYMLAGAMTFAVGDETYTLRKGDSLYFDANLPHTTEVIGKTAARFICLFIDDQPLDSQANPIASDNTYSTSTNRSSTTTRKRTRVGRPGDKLK